MNEIQKFAAFVREQAVETVVRQQEQFLNGPNGFDAGGEPPLRVREALLQTLATAENNVTIGNGLSGLMKTVPSSITANHFFHAQQKALLHILPSYTTDAATIISLVTAINNFYFTLQKFSESKQPAGLPHESEELQLYSAKLAQREANLKFLITQAPDAIIVIDAAGKIILWNPKAEEIFGWQRAEAVGKTLEETIIPAAYRQAHNAGMRRYLSTRVSHILNQTIEISAINKEGKEFPISLTISQSEQAGKTFFISFIRDISAQKKAEAELLRQRKELEHFNRELEQYAWLTSHDLREPLRKILTFSDLILTRYKTGVSAEVAVFLEKIQDAGERMGNLINAILLYSGITEEHRLFETVDLNNVLDETLADLEVTIKESGTLVQAGPLPVIEGIPFQLKQLLQNLVANAIKYRSPHREPVIHISAATKNVDSIELCIEDNGSGFAVQDEKKIFGLFQRLHSDKSIKGTGVGLALCKKIVLNHGGAISVESKAGEGSRFYVTLPIKQTRG